MVVSKSDLIKFFDTIQSKFDVFVPYQTERENDDLVFKKYDPEKEFILDKYRTVDPVRTLFYMPSESVLPPSAKSNKRIIAGVKNCDLLGLAVLDDALLKDNFVEPNYKIWRDSSYIISCDCTDTLQTCHCVLLDNNPYPNNDTEGQALFDLNLSPVDDKFIIEVGSKKGEELIEKIKEVCSLAEVTDKDKEIREANRAEVLKKVRDINSDFTPDRHYDVITENKEASVWKEFCNECVQCGACTNICPTCYCLILNDESTKEEFRKVRSWDSCQLVGYAEVAGGGTPREHRWETFRNRYQCKYNFMKFNFDKLGCTGCGRCISACPAEIDLREVIQSLQEV